MPVKKQEKYVKEGQEVLFTDLHHQITKILELNKNQLARLYNIENKVNELTKEREEKAARKKALANKKRVTKRSSITLEIYKLLIQKILDSDYISIRLRIAFFLLMVTGVQISDLLPLKIRNLEVLLKNHWIEINNRNQKSLYHKTFLTFEGIKLLKEREKDFNSLFQIKNSDSYVFSPRLKHFQSLSRETLTKDINRVMNSISQSFPDQPNFTSYNFKNNNVYICKNSEDITFVLNQNRTKFITCFKLTDKKLVKFVNKQELYRNIPVNESIKESFEENLRKTN